MDDRMIYICNLAEMPGHVANLGPSHVISLTSPLELPETPRGIGQGRHLRLGVHDISEPLDGHVLPGPEHVETLIRFIQDWQPQAGALLVHCFAGISRSTAAALIALVAKAPRRERVAVEHLRASAPHAMPNRRMIQVADEQLGCGGRLIEAHAAMVPPQGMLYTGPLVELAMLD